MHEDTFDGHDWGWAQGSWHLLGKGQGRCEISCKAQDSSPQQRIIWPRMSIVLLLETLSRRIEITVTVALLLLHDSLLYVALVHARDLYMLRPLFTTGIVIPSVWVRKLKSREVTGLVQDQTTHKCRTRAQTKVNQTLRSRSLTSVLCWGPFT